jgi:GGDEF domain-containing protein
MAVVLNREAPVGELAAWIDLSLSLVEALRDKVFHWDRQAYEDFKAELDRILEALKNGPPPSSILVYAGTLAEKIENHCRSAQRTADASIAELQAIIRVLIAAMDQVRADSAKAAGDLQEVEEMIAKTSTAEDLRLAKVHLTQALGKLRRQEEDRRQKAAELVVTHSATSGDPGPAGGSRALSEEPRAQSSPGAPPRDSAAVRPIAGQLTHSTQPGDKDQPQLDPSTGLPNKAAARDCFALLGANPSHLYLAAFFVRQMEQINARYGSKTGNEVLSMCAKHIGNLLLRPADQLFRWDGPRFVALLEREDSLMDVRRELRRVIPGRFRCELRNGSMLLSVAVAADAIAVPQGDVEQVMDELEKEFAEALLRRTS